MEQDLKGVVVNEAPVEPQSRTLSEPAGENKSCFPLHTLNLSPIRYYSIRIPAHLFPMPKI